MASAKITFANNSVLIVTDRDIIRPVVNEDNCGYMLGLPIELIPHVHDGLIAPLYTLIGKYDFFRIEREPDVIYGIKSIVKIERID